MSTMNPEMTRLDLSAIRARLASENGPRYWRSLEEIAETSEFRSLLENEFPEQASEWSDPVGRRRFLQLMGASFALAGLGACTRQPEEKIVPFARSPEALLPGKPLYFATAIALGGYATGVLVESHMGRPTKIEGNPKHPASLGATEAITQASILNLYDPDRSQVPTQRGRISRWFTFVGDLGREIEAQRLVEGAGLRVLTPPVTSPTLADQIALFEKMFPRAKWHQYDPCGRESARLGARLAFGADVHTWYRFDRAEVIVSLDADFLSQGPGTVRYARDFVAKRRAGAEGAAMNRLYVLEAMPSNTGAMADHRLRLSAGAVEEAARALAEALSVATGRAANMERLPQGAAEWIAAVGRDLQGHRGASIVIAGDQQPPAVHALAHAINERLGNMGQTVMLTEPVEARPVDQRESLAQLVNDMNAGQVEVLLIAEGNPVYDAPADLNFAAALDKVKFRAHLSLYDDETSRLCHWHIPGQHWLESWSDTRAYDGTVSIIQPLIAPLYAGKSVLDFVSAAMGNPEPSNYDLVREYWRGRSSGGDFETFWVNALNDGVVPNSAAAPRAAKVRPEFAAQLTAASTVDSPAAGSLEVNFRPDPTVWDGRYANNGWLQELPKPITTLTWDNAVMISPATAERLGVHREDVVELKSGERAVSGPVWVVPGHADDSVTVHLGYGRERTGRVGSGTGFNAYRLRTMAGFWVLPGVAITKTNRRYALARTQLHHGMEGRYLVRTATVEEFRENPDFVKQFEHGPQEEMSLYPGFEYKGYSWGLALDLNSCIGCNACMAACTAENNVPVVGKDQVIAGREMHWIRVDRYHEGSLDDPELHHQPVMCMHCENAPCEPVCPVGATMHSSEGLNEMVYNRCVGTRYCSNNCPYKVRRFNFLLYSDFETPSLKMMRNPDVTVRSRGVMEKCTYCVQRINLARIDAEKEGRRIQDGEIRTACQQVCPAEAIVFGDINDPASKVSQLKANSRNYGLLEETNTKPRTSYLARLKNPNPEIAVTEPSHG